MTFAHRCVKGFIESQRQAVERLIESHCFRVDTFLRLPGEVELRISYEPGCAERWEALEKALQTSVNKDIRIV